MPKALSHLLLALLLATPAQAMKKRPPPKQQAKQPAEDGEDNAESFPKRAPPTNGTHVNFTQTVGAGTEMQISAAKFEQALKGYQWKQRSGNVAAGTIISLYPHNGASLISPGDLDFHVSAVTDRSNQWVQKIHFALRDETAGKSAVVYWWYALKKNGANPAAWSFDGFNGKGNETALIAKLGGSDMVGDQILALILSKLKADDIKPKTH
jgi:hypothetical protein